MFSQGCEDSSASKMFIVQAWQSQFKHKNPAINVKWSHALEILVVSSDIGTDQGQLASQAGLLE